MFTRGTRGTQGGSRAQRAMARSASSRGIEALADLLTKTPVCGTLPIDEHWESVRDAAQEPYVDGR